MSGVGSRALLRRRWPQTSRFVDLLKRIGARKKATPGQIAIAWLLVQKRWIVPIPGTRKLARLDENLGAAKVILTAEDLKEIDSAASNIQVQGGRGTGREQYV